MLRFSLVTVTDGAPVGVGSYVMVVAAGNKAIVKHIVPDATAIQSNTLADVSVDADGIQVDIVATPLSAAQRTTIKTWLTAQGIPNAWLDSSITNRKQLLIQALKRLANRLDWDLTDIRAFLLSWDVSDAPVPVYTPPYIPPEPVFVGEVPPPGGGA